MAKISIDIPVRWSDLDAYGHVNNAAMLTLLEEARIKVFWSQQTGTSGEGLNPGEDPSEAVDPDAAADPNATLAATIGNALMGDAGAETQTVIASQQIEYIIQIPWNPHPVRVDVWVGKIGGASFDVSYTITTPSGELAAKAATTVVVIDAATGRPKRLTPHQVEALKLILEDPVTFRR